MRIETYSTRPDSVEAVQLTRENIHDVADWCGGDPLVEPKASDPSDVYMALTVPRANGPIDAQIGMYILKNSRGRFEVMTEPMFDAKYGRSAGSAGPNAPKTQSVGVVGSSVFPGLDFEDHVVVDSENHRAQGSTSARRTLFGKPSGR